MSRSDSFFGHKQQFCEDAPKRFSKDANALPKPPEADDQSESDTLQFARRVSKESFGNKRPSSFLDRTS